MRVWVRSEYAAELAVVLAWMTAVLPWNVTFSTLSGIGSLLFVRFPLFQIRYAFGIPLGRAIQVSDPYSALVFQRGQTIAAAYEVWLAGAMLVALALVLSVVMYAAEERIERFRPVTLMGILLLVAGLVHAVATYLLWTRGFPGVPLPVGVAFQLVFGALLLSATRAE